MKYPLLPPLLVILLLCLPAGPEAAANDAPPHPYVLFPADRLESLRKRFDEPRNRPVKQRVIEEAEQFLLYSGEGKFEGTPGAFSSYKAWAQQGAKAKPAFLWAYILTGDTRFSDALLEMYRHEWKIRANLKQSDFRFEFTTKSDGYTAALTYDALWPILSEEDRSAFGTYIDQYLVFMPKPSFGWKNNIGTGYFSAVGLIALARLHENPLAAEILKECIQRLKSHPYPSSFEPHPDGGYPEGALYMDYALLFLLPFVDAYERITGDKSHGLLDPEFFKNTQGFAATMIGGDGAWIPFYDSQPQDYGAAWMAFLGRRTDNPLLLWGSDYFFDRIIADPSSSKRREAARSLIPNILYRDWSEPHPFPGFPTLSLLPSLNTGSMRSDGALKPGLMLAVRGFGDREENMRSQHKDVGSFVLYSRGENFLIDPGYYQPEPEAHSMPEIDGASAQIRAPSPLEGFESGDLRILSIDPGTSYTSDGKSVPDIQRTWLMDGDRAVILVDEISGSVPVRSRFQTGFETLIQPDGKSAIIRGKNSDLWMGAFGPEVKMKVSGPLDFGKSWAYKVKAEEGKVGWHRVEADYESGISRPMIWVFVPISAGGDVPKVIVDAGDQKFTATIGNGRPLSFVRTAKGWAPK